MSLKIKKIEIDNLFATKNILWELGNTNVLVGKNGSGKSTLLRIIKSVVSRQELDNTLVCDKVLIKFDRDDVDLVAQKMHLGQNDINVLTNTLLNSPEVLEIIKKDIKSKNNSKLLDQDNTFIDILKKNLESKFKEGLPSVSGGTKINVEFISTLNLSANSINRVQTSDGEDSTILKFEINHEIQKLLSNKNSKLLKTKLVTVLNRMFFETGKRVVFEKDLKVRLDLGEIIPYTKLSSGEQQIIYIFLKVANATLDKALILMDEPEISLHLSWQEKLIAEMRNINPDSQIIIVTHSPAIIMNGWHHCYKDIKDIIV